jgi:hypothetical protein
MVGLRKGVGVRVLGGYFLEFPKFVNDISGYNAVDL